MTDEKQAQVLQQARGGSPEAFAQIVREHQAAVRGYIAQWVRAPDLIDDLAQETFLGAFRSLDGYKGDASLRFWLLGVARRRTASFLRDDFRQRGRISRFRAEMTIWMIAAIDADGDGGDDRDRRSAALDRCIERLQGDSAKLFADFYGASMSVANIARKLGKKEGAIKVALYRVRQALRACVEHRIALGGDT